MADFFVVDKYENYYMAQVIGAIALCIGWQTYLVNRV
jgi:hypothetical protein